MTGYHMGHAYIRGNLEIPLRPEDVTVAKILKGDGYATGVIGKWGLGLADNSGRPNNRTDVFYVQLRSSDVRTPVKAATGTAASPLRAPAAPRARSVLQPRGGRRWRIG
jgi:arylsulfatase A-like enzyme